MPYVQKIRSETNWPPLVQFRLGSLCYLLVPLPKKCFSVVSTFCHRWRKNPLQFILSSGRLLWLMQQNCIHHFQKSNTSFLHIKLYLTLRMKYVFLHTIPLYLGRVTTVFTCCKIIQKRISNKYSIFIYYLVEKYLFRIIIIYCHTK